MPINWGCLMLIIIARKHFVKGFHQVITNKKVKQISLCVVIVENQKSSSSGVTCCYAVLSHISPTQPNPTQRVGFTCGVPYQIRRTLTHVAYEASCLSTKCKKEKEKIERQRSSKRRTFANLLPN